MELTAQDLTPIFHSETSSSYLLMRYLNRGVNALRFVALVHALDPDFLDPAGFTQGEVEREYFYKDQGSVDLRIPLAHPSGRKAVVLVEVKVHDQASATRDQIGTYFKAEQGATGADVYFVYLTQFTRRSLEGAGVRKEPRTLTEFGRAKREFGFRVAHLAWQDCHGLLDAPGEPAPETDALAYLLSLQRRWMTGKCARDLMPEAPLKWQRRFEDYFPTTPSRLDELKALGHEESGGLLLRIELRKLEADALRTLEDIIRSYGNSPDIPDAHAPTSGKTLLKARETLLELAGHCDHWPLLGFFSRIFAFAHAQRNLRLFGGGNFAIHFWSRAEKASRSLCTLYPKTMEITFQLRR